MYLFCIYFVFILYLFYIFAYCYFAIVVIMHCLAISFIYIYVITSRLMIIKMYGCTAVLGVEIEHFWCHLEKSNLLCLGLPRTAKIPAGEILKTRPERPEGQG